MFECGGEGEISVGFGWSKIFFHAGHRTCDSASIGVRVNEVAGEVFEGQREFIVLHYCARGVEAGEERISFAFGERIVGNARVINTGFFNAASDEARVQN